MKRHDPMKRSLAEQRSDSNRAYGRIIKDKKTKLEPVWLKDYYGVKGVGK